MTFKQQLIKITPLFIVVGGLFAYSFMNAQWKGPNTAPPNSNVSAPINIGTSTDSIQNGFGDLIFNRFVAKNAVWSPEYCNRLGDNCILQEDLNYLSGEASAEMDTKQVPPGGSISVSCSGVINGSFNPIAVSTMTGGGCSMAGVYKELTVNGGQILSYPTNWMGATMPPKWICENKNLATTTITVYAMCLTLYAIPPDFSGGA